MTRRPYIAGNWKMFKTTSETHAYVAELLPKLANGDGADVSICVPFTSLQAATAAAGSSALKVCAQNMHWEEQGPYTGEISPTMLNDVGVYGVVLGHSERRQLFGETDRALQEKVPSALAHGLEPILCVGETEEERENDETQRRLRHQVQEGLEKVAEAQLAEVVIAYEPIWAIGTGKVATPEIAQDACSFVRALVGDRSKDAAQRVRVLYGGSVKPDNAAELLGQPDIDGALVGGGSLDPSTFAEIVAAAG
ncbi:MAG: triosephosphate isomerase [Thermoleophilales bacterium]|nr:triosephosphate isomerase [Thermoleophilales bacterium]